MPTFGYRAMDTAGKASRGVVEAATLTAARALLRERGLLPVSVKPAATARRREILAWNRRVSAKALSQVTGQLSTLLGANVRIEEALRIVGDVVEGPAAGVLLSVRGAILEGRGLAAALGDHPGVFPEFYRASVAAAEQAGRLPQVMAHLADFVDRRERSRQKIQLAMIYPTLLATVSLLIIGFLLVYVMPSIVKVFVTHGATLPILTRGLIALSNLAQRYGAALALTALAAGLAMRQTLKAPANRLRLARFLANRSPLSSFVRRINAARFAGSLATLVTSQVPLVEAMLASAAVTPNLHIRQKVLAAAGRVREGASLHRAMSEARVFPPMLLAIVASGEGGAGLGDSLTRAATDLDRDLETQSAALVALVEPVVVLFMGGVVLLLVLAILLPIISLNNMAGT
jgi:general secretion pathway protein F